MPAPRLLLLTDSHGACIAAAAAAAGIPAVGKPLAGGRLLNRQFHEFDGRDIRFSDSLADARYRAALNELGVPCASEISCPVLCTLGGNFHFLARGEAWDGFAIPGSDQAGHAGLHGPRDIGGDLPGRIGEAVLEVGVDRQ